MEIMNEKTMSFGLLALALVSVGTLAACSSAAEIPPAVTANPPAVEDSAVPAAPETDSDADPLIVDDSGNTSIDGVALATAMPSPSLDALSQEEIDGLRYMREEEKLARDVYLTLYDQWGVPIFQNIASSEATHTEAVKTLLDRYSLEDPADGKDTGVFTDPELQALYDQLVAAGRSSRADALRVGAAIEEIDILDLEERIAQTDKDDIILVYENLLKGSRNHLRAFVSTLERQEGETYQPQYLTPAAYDAIVSTDIERGGRGRGKGSGS
jgi:hypothetical protein